MVSIRKMASHPARGAWIEIAYPPRPWPGGRRSHPARGAWIEMFISVSWTEEYIGRTPQGVRGLKFRRWHCRPPLRRSHPARGAWIEIFAPHPDGHNKNPSHPARGAWIEIVIHLLAAMDMDGRTPQGVRGLKFFNPQQGALSTIVAPRKGCVD